MGPGPADAISRSSTSTTGHNALEGHARQLESPARRQVTDHRHSPAQGTHRATARRPRRRPRDARGLKGGHRASPPTAELSRGQRQLGPAERPGKLAANAASCWWGAQSRAQHAGAFDGRHVDPGRSDALRNGAAGVLAAAPTGSAQGPDPGELVLLDPGVCRRVWGLGPNRLVGRGPGSRALRGPSNASSWDGPDLAVSAGTAAVTRPAPCARAHRGLPEQGFRRCGMGSGSPSPERHRRRYNRRTDSYDRRAKSPT